MGVSKNRDTPKWIVKIMENPIKMEDMGENPLFLETPHIHPTFQKGFAQHNPSNTLSSITPQAIFAGPLTRSAGA